MNLRQRLPCVTRHCRLMFKLVNGSASRRFGVVLADKSTGMMESGESRWHCHLSFDQAVI